MGEITAISWCDHTKPGPAPMPPRDGDKQQARQRINVEVRTGYRPHPNSLACVDCSHVWSEGERRHEYDHHLGYAPAHHYDVEPVCTVCHAARHNKQTHCGQGHEFTAENTTIKRNGTRECMTCRKVWDSNQHRGRDAAYWRAYRAERKARHG